VSQVAKDAEVAADAEKATKGASDVRVLEEEGPPELGSEKRPFDPAEKPAPGEKPNYPPRDGAAGTIEPETLEPGDRIDRFTGEPRGEVETIGGKETLIDEGGFSAKAGTPMADRAIPPTYDDAVAEALGQKPGTPVPPKQYVEYQVQKDLEVGKSRAAPAFGEKGGGTQYTNPTDPAKGRPSKMGQLMKDGKVSREYSVNYHAEDISAGELADIEAAEAKPWDLWAT
jgi:hypothetical protein